MTAKEFYEMMKDYARKEMLEQGEKAARETGSKVAWYQGKSEEAAKFYKLIEMSWLLKSDYLGEEYDTDKLERECGKVEYNGKTYWLTQQAYIDNLTECGDTTAVYKALAIDRDGNDYKIIWQIIDGFDGDDEADACDWDKPYAIYDDSNCQI